MSAGSGVAQDHAYQRPAPPEFCVPPSPPTVKTAGEGRTVTVTADTESVPWEATTSTGDENPVG